MDGGHDYNSGLRRHLPGDNRRTHHSDFSDAGRYRDFQRHYGVYRGLSGSTKRQNLEAPALGVEQRYVEQARRKDETVGHGRGTI